MGRSQRLLRWANLIVIFLTLFAYLSPYIDPGTLWPFSVLGLFYPALLLLNILFILTWLFLRKPYFLFSLGCILLGWHHFTSFFGVHPGTGRLPADTEQLRVMSYNVFGLKNETGTTGNRWSKDELLTFYHRYQPDVLCFQEFTTVPRHSDRFTEILRTQTPLTYVYRDPHKALAVFSRFPLTTVTTRYFGNNSNGYMIADVAIGERTVRLFNIHLQSNAVSRLADEVTSNGNLQERETWLQIRGMIGRYRRSAGRRAEQSLEIRERVMESPHPVILCGDFNDVPLSYTYHVLSEGLLDGFRQRGWGFGTTFRGNLPGLRIDYIFSSPAIQPRYYQILPTSRSDHYPVMSVLDWAE